MIQASQAFPASGHLPGADAQAPGENERHWAASAHLSALVLAMLTSWVAGGAGVAGAGVVYAIKHQESAFVADHAREAINFNLSMFIYACAAVVIAIALVGATVLTLGLGLILTIPAGIALAFAAAGIAVLWLVCSIVATVHAFNGQPYRYPLSLRLFR
ncbi:DUF4870 domain-containing protein [Cognatiluteimonas telluris]|jgi:uncharacterized Tic20 family protein|uniref:DUF4870 domain-containing protein n=1 Tax=Cognatiluteimonas telluris TaxID=1104775 RepID=UPI001409AF18|nr:DUF4870 domain-containing protein [Lysobacter telluris]